MSTARRLAAILAVDVAGYSRLMGEDEAGTAKAVREHREAARQIVASHGGRIVKIMGDGVLLEFPSVVAAVECAIAVQKLMAARNADVPDGKRITYRIGVHLGDVLIEGEDIVGDGVNIAARLEGIAEPGGICLSRAAHEQVEGKVEARFADWGERELKNIARSVRVYAIENSSPSRRKPGPAVGEDSPGGSVDPDFRRGGDKGEGAEKDGPPRLSMVVLPFANLGGDPEQEYFVDGVTESLTTDLSRIAGSFVIARNTAFTYKGKAADVKQVGRELNVRYVLEGSVQRGGNRMRVNVQLIDAETGNHLWAERFDKPVADLFDMQDEIVARLANQLNHELVVAEVRRSESLRPHELSAVDLAMRGWSELQEYTMERGRRARPWFEAALREDERNVDALIGLAECIVLPLVLAVSDHRDADIEEAEATIAKALLIAPNTARLHYVNGMLMSAKGSPAGELREQEIAIQLDRNFAMARVRSAAALISLDRPEETAPLVAEAMRLSPRDIRLNIFYLALGIADLFLDKLDAAIEHLRRSVELNPNHWPAYFYLAAVLSVTGNDAEARAACANGLRILPNYSVAKLRSSGIGQNLSNSAAYERAIDGMRRAGLPEE